MNDACFYFTFGGGAVVGVLIGMILGAHCAYKEIEEDNSQKDSKKELLPIKKALNSKPKLRLVE